MPAPVNYFEIGGPDADAARGFYRPLFDWSFGDPSPAAYRMVNGDRGGLWDTGDAGGDSWAIFYVLVEDVRATLVQAEALCATVVVPCSDNGVIEFAHLRDPRPPPLRPCHLPGPQPPDPVPAHPPPLLCQLLQPRHTMCETRAVRRRWRSP